MRHSPLSSKRKLLVIDDKVSGIRLRLYYKISSLEYCQILANARGQLLNRCSTIIAFLLF